jgi:hypothetical protein
MATVVEATSPIVMVTGTTLAAATPAGIGTPTWQKTENHDH